MSRFFSKFTGEKEQRPDLNPGNTEPFASNNPYRHSETQPQTYEPPPGPPPSNREQGDHCQTSTQGDQPPPPYHDWTSIPDTSLLPPPPPLMQDYSSTSNASFGDAEAAHAWCANHPVHAPRIAHASVIEGVRSGRNGMKYPPGFAERGWSLKPLDPTLLQPNTLGATPTSAYQILSPSNSSSIASYNSNSGPTTSRHFLQKFSHSYSITPSDAAWLSTLPLYLAATSNPLSPHFMLPKSVPYTIYFELTPLKYHSPDSTVSIGFAALPYPTNRQPGWHRASIGIHSDDGNRYVNNSWGGREFTAPFREAEAVGLAVRFSPERFVESQTSSDKSKTTQSQWEVTSELPRCKTRAYLVRNGIVSGTWDMDEERDAEKDEGVAGLMGEVDLYAAVGVFGDVDVEVRFYTAGEGFVPPPD